uniref:Glycoprotein B n=1 Tax=Suid herpesvirus 1 TaxID=10345 RepID=A0A0M3PMN9_SUHV|nr:glycoprotein B [Suid alphaherpesvirus 1]
MPAGGGLWRGPRGHRPGHHGGAGLGRLWPAPHHAAAARGAVALALLLLALAATPTCGAAAVTRAASAPPAPGTGATPDGFSAEESLEEIDGAVSPGPSDAPDGEYGDLDARTAVRAAATERDRFYVCPPPSGSTVVRLEPEQACPEYSQGRNFTEGIAVLFKENIAPHKFKAHIYYKNVIVTTVWSGSTYAAITNRFTDRVPVPVQEITDVIDRRGKCVSKAEYVRNNHKVTAFDRDENPVEVDLRPSRLNALGTRGWHTTNDTYTKIGAAGFYHTGTSVNCIVEEVEARSVYPYDSFALSTGDIVYMSPFYGLREGAHGEHIGYAPGRFQQVEHYYPIDLDSRLRASGSVTRNFLRTPHFTVAWDWAPKTRRVCSLAKWREAEEMIRDETRDGSFRFTSRALGASFVSDVTQLDLQRVHLGDCVLREASEAIGAIYRRRYNNTHVLAGDKPEVYLARGGFVVAFRPLISNELAQLYARELERLGLAGVVGPASPAAARRARRSPGPAGTPEPPAVNGTGHLRITTGSAEFARLQFTYDHIQAHVNDMLSRIAAAWCELQNKDRTLWGEMSRLNPSAVATAALGQRVSARMLGDVMAISRCVEVRGGVYVQNSMRVPGERGTCYSRPLVTFEHNGTGVIEGQLGDDNELLISRDLIEPCTGNHRRYFKLGGGYVYCEDYSYVRMVEAPETISTRVTLNLTLLEDREFLPLEVYTREELADTGLLDYSEIQRRNQLHALKFYDIDRVVKVDHNVVLLRGIANFFQGLGDVGAAVGKVVLGATGAVISAVGGMVSFLSNPFGALAIGLLVLAGLVAAFLAYRHISRLRRNPMKALYPVTTKALKEDGVEEDDVDEAKLDQARDMIRYMPIVSALEQQEHKARKKNSGPALLASRVGAMATRRRHYQRLENEDPDAP